MKAYDADQLVYGYLFPKRSERDPADFGQYVQRQLIPEVRREVLAFFGHLDTDEARYPGLDYTNRIHRIRLSRWRHHRELFRAFDALRLTSGEISALTRWEGTKWARDNHERMRSEVILDTAAEHMPHWPWLYERPIYPSTGRPALPRTLRPRKDRMTGISKDAEYELTRTSLASSPTVNGRPVLSVRTTYLEEDDESLPPVKSDGNDNMGENHNLVGEEQHDTDTDDLKDDYMTDHGDSDHEMDDDSDEDADDDNVDVDEEAEVEQQVTSVGEALNERLRAQAARRNAGDLNVVMDAEWEAWLAWFKNSAERGIIPSSPAYMTSATAAAARSYPSPISPTRSTPRSLPSQHHQHHHPHSSQQFPYPSLQLQHRESASYRSY